MLKEVCPVCWRSNCRLFVRMNNLKFTDKERRDFVVAFHRRVCCVCKKLFCNGLSCDRRALNEKKFCIPQWMFYGKYNQ